MPLRAANDASSGIRRETMPPMWTTIMPTVSRVMRRSASSGAVPSDSGSVSINTGRPPACITAAAVAKNVLAGTRTSFPSTPKARKAISIAEVPLLTATACLTLQPAANFSSNSAPYFPSVSWPVSRTSAMRSAIQRRSSGEKSMRAEGTDRKAGFVSAAAEIDVTVQPLLLLLSLSERSHELATSLCCVLKQITEPSQKLAVRGSFVRHGHVGEHCGRGSIRRFTFCAKIDRNYKAGLPDTRFGPKYPPGVRLDVDGLVKSIVWLLVACLSQAVGNALISIGMKEIGGALDL